MPYISEFKKCSECSPEKRGNYLVIKFYDNKLSYAADVEFIPGYGWNVGVNSDGTVDTHARIMYEEDRRAMWAKVEPLPEEIKKERWEDEVEI